MGTNSGKKARKEYDEEVYVEFNEIKPLNYIQESYLDAIKRNEIVFGVGSAGTGKTYVAAGYAAGELYYRRVGKIVLTRPNVEASRGLGFTPGTLDEKYLPYLEPFQDVFIHTLGKGFFEWAIKHEAIDPKPLGFLRGVTFSNCIVLVDEVQNCTKKELKMLLSRIGKNCKIILSGDDNQFDIRDSGLEDALNRLDHIEGIETVKFLDADIVRSRMCKEIIKAYKN